MGTILTPSVVDTGPLSRPRHLTRPMKATDLANDKFLLVPRDRFEFVDQQARASWIASLERGENSILVGIAQLSALLAEMACRLHVLVSSPALVSKITE